MSSNHSAVYKNLIFTKHAYTRLRDRSVNFENIFQTIKNPSDKVQIEDGKTKFFKEINSRKHQVVAKFLPKEKKWLVISVWVRGEEDKVPLAWQLITLPFKLIWKLLRIIFQSGKNT